MFRITFPNSSLGELSPLLIKEFIFKTSYNKLYPIAELTLTNFSIEFSNYIQIGMDVDVIFTEGDKSYTNHMKVYSCNKGAQSIEGFSVINMILISGWHFISTIGTKAYRGTVGGIIGDIFIKDNDKFSDYTKFISTINPNYLTGVASSASSETEMFRYRLGEGVQPFMKRILKYGRVNGLPIYLYGNAKGETILASLSNFITTPVQYTFYDVAPSLNVETLTSSSTTSNETLLKYDIINNSDKASSKLSIRLTNDHFGHIEGVASGFVSTSGEEDNNQSKTKSPEKVEYLDWSILPSDGISIACNKATENNLNTFSLFGSVLNIRFKPFEIGTTFNFVLSKIPKSDEKKTGKSNLGEGTYIITEVSYIYDSNSLITTFKAIQIKS